MYHLLHRRTLSYQAIWLKTWLRAAVKELQSCSLIEEGYLRVSQVGLGLCWAPQTLSGRSHPRCHCEHHRCPPGQRSALWMQPLQAGRLIRVAPDQDRVSYIRDVRISVKSRDHATELRKQVANPQEAGSDTVRVCVCEPDTITCLNMF